MKSIKSCTVCDSPVLKNSFDSGDVYHGETTAAHIRISKLKINFWSIYTNDLFCDFNEECFVVVFSAIIYYDE